jgi:tRNA dimethylallyltransferase
MIKALAIIGPTATGKTELALMLAQKFPIEIISVDSALIYKGMDIGTAKPTVSEQLQVKHHLIDIISPLESYSVMQFITDTRHLILEINSRGKVPVLVGGTMMYFNALLNGISELPKACPEIRLELQQQSDKFGISYLHQQLLNIDSISAGKIEPTDSQRIIRALEIYKLTGQTMSFLQKNSPKQRLDGVEILTTLINPKDRSILHQRINNRFENMIKHGFIDEVRQLRNLFPEINLSYPSMRCVGYSQVFEYIEAEENKIINSISAPITLNDMMQKGQAATRQLAKRQITWLPKFKGYNLALNNPNLEIKQLYNLLELAVKTIL